MVIFNPAQANFLFKQGATDGSKLESLLERWNQMAQENRVRKGLVK